MKKYCLAVLILALNVFVIGVLLPYLISAASTELVLTGILAVVVLLPVDVCLLKLLFKRGTTV